MHAHLPERLFDDLEREFVFAAHGRRTAVLAQVQRLLVAVARIRADALEAHVLPPGRDVELVRRYRELVEGVFRSHTAIDALAARLAVTPSRLNRACRSAAGTSALGIVHERVMIEAKRSLLYTSMTVAEVAAALGFADPAYFNRFFTTRAGCPPAEFRRRSAAGTRAAAAEVTFRTPSPRAVRQGSRSIKPAFGKTIS